MRKSRWARRPLHLESDNFWRRGACRWFQPYHPFQNGAYTFTGHIHDSGFPSYNDAFDLELPEQPFAHAIRLQT